VYGWNIGFLFLRSPRSVHNIFITIWVSRGLPVNLPTAKHGEVEEEEKDAGARFNPGAFGYDMCLLGKKNQRQ